MKRAAMTTVVVVGIAACSFAQSNPPAPQNTQAGQPAGQAAPAPTGKRPPQAKTQPEFDAYKAAAALTDPAAQEKAADDFAAKFADSELRAVLYKSAMHGYQQANNADKMMDMWRSVPAIPTSIKTSALPKRRKMRNALCLRWRQTSPPPASRRTESRLTKASCVRRHTPFWALWSTTPKLGRTQRETCVSPLMRSHNRWIRLRCCGCRSHWTIRKNIPRPSSTPA